jgi:hypothetical protein
VKEWARRKHTLTTRIPVIYITLNTSLPIHRPSEGHCNFRLYTLGWFTVGLTFHRY